MSTSVCNTAGEWEREARSRRANLLDAFGAECALLAILWPLGFGWGILGQAGFVHPACEVALRLAALWVILGSRIWHRDSAESLGLGSPGRLWRLLRTRAGWARLRLGGLVLAVFSGVLCLGATHWPKTARFLLLPKALREWPGTPPEWVAMWLFCAVLAAIVATVLVRYDNLGSSFPLAMTLAAALLEFSVLAAAWHRGPKAFEAFGSERYLLDFSGYIMWGMIQQLVFISYFGTRMRRGFGPSQKAGDVVPPHERPRRIGLAGLVAALTLGPAFWAILRMIDGPQATFTLLGGCILFCFPVGAIWMLFYCRGKRRLLVAALSGTFFGAIHLNSYGLVLVTTVLGTIFAYVAMEDRYRNLAAFGFVHGLLGSAFSKMFQHAGVLAVSFRVGPWNIPEPSPAALVVPMLYLAAYALLAFWITREPREPGEIEPATLATEPALSP